MPYLVNIYYQSENVTTNNFENESDAQHFAKQFIQDRIDKVPENSKVWAASVYSSVITPMEETILPNYNLED